MVLKTLTFFESFSSLNSICNYFYSFDKCEYQVSEWSRYLTADRLVIVRELMWANICMHQSSLIKLAGHMETLHRVNELKLGPTSILADSHMPLFLLQKLTYLYVLKSSGHWHQRFERALLWYMIMSCNLSRQKFNTTKMGPIPDLPFHTSLPEYRGNKNNVKKYPDIVDHETLFIWLQCTFF